MRMRSATLKLWDGVRMGSVQARPDPDGPVCRVRLPVSWNSEAAGALAALAAADGSADLAQLADWWLARAAGAGDAELAADLQALLLRQVGAPAEAAWGRQADGLTGYVLNLATLGHISDHSALAEWARLGCRASAKLWPAAGRPRLVVTGLSGLIAASGLGYDSSETRDGAARLLQNLRHAVPGALLAADPPGWVDALLGVEVAGIAPAFGPLEPTGRLSRTSMAYLAARGIAPEAALASLLAGADPLPTASFAAHAAMHATLRPLLDELPPLLRAMPAVRPPASRENLAARRGGYAQKAAIGGQKIFVRTGEYADGRLGEVAITLPHASPAVRALVECLSQAIGIGLQHGIPLAEFVDAMAGTRFGASGTVEGDPAVPRATSPLDYVARNLAHAYLPDAKLPPADPEGDDPAPLLPLDFSVQPPSAGRRRGLRVVK